jgi:hypothetical protein
MLANLFGRQDLFISEHDYHDVNILEAIIYNNFNFFSTKLEFLLHGLTINPELGKK